MKTAFDKGFFHGDVALLPLKALPDGLVERTGPEANVVAHSETGHHHVVEGEVRVFDSLERDPLVCYLQIDGDYGDLVHQRSWHTHETVRMPQGSCWEVRAQEYAGPTGWARVRD